MSVLALDIGRVCVRLTMDKSKEFFGLPLDKTYPESWLSVITAYTRGKIGSEEYSKAISELTGGRFTNEQIKYGWNLWIGDEIKETTVLIRTLIANGWKIYFLSDIQPWHLEAVMNKISFADVVSEGIFSCDIDAEKPEELMYVAFEQKYGKPDLYIDDLEKNIIGAQKRGWNAIQYLEAEHPAERIMKMLNVQPVRLS